MVKMIYVLIILCISFLVYASEEKASNVILKYAGEIKKVMKKNLSVEKKKGEIKKIVDEILDYNELAKRSLGRHYKDRSYEEINRFNKLMRELIETSYLRKITSDAEYEFKIKSEDKEEGDLVVSTEISTKDGKVEVGFAMFKKDERWFVYDLIIDEVSTLKNYKSEFNKIIKEHGFDMVIKKMENKLLELKGESEK